MRELFDYPSAEIWGKRRAWIDSELDAMITKYGECESSIHALSLFWDMSSAFCAGAWISVIVMSVSVIDAQLRETEALDENIKTFDLLRNHYNGEGIDWLRKLRNEYVHVNVGCSWFNDNDYFLKQDELERNATIAVSMSIKALFQNPILP